MKRFVFVVLVSILAIFGICMLAACEKRDSDFAKTVSSYEMELEFSGNILVGKQTVDVMNFYAEGIDSISFNLYPNAYAEGATHKAYTGTLPHYGGIELNTVKVGGAAVEFSIDESGSLLSVPVPAMKIEDRCVIYMEYTVTVPTANLRFGMSGDAVNLANFYPQLAVYENGEFRSDPFSIVGDPFVSDVANYNITLTYEEGYTVASSGKQLSVTEGEGKTTLVCGANLMRDFAFVLNRGYQVETGSVGDIDVFYYHTGDSLAVERLALAVNALTVFQREFGDYPYETFSVAATPFAYSGMEFSALVYIADDVEDFSETVIHETAHQWWYGIVGSNGVTNSYLDEGLTTFMTAYFYKLNGQEDTYLEKIKEIEDAYFHYERLQKMRGSKGTVSIEKSIYDYTSYQYNMLVYHKGALLFKNVLDTVGEQKFIASLKEYADSNRFRMANSDTLIAAFNKGCKTDMSGFIKGFLGEQAVLTMLSQ